MQNVPLGVILLKRLLKHNYVEIVVTLEFWDHFANFSVLPLIGEVDFINIRSVESPAIFLLDEVPVVLQSIQKDIVILSHPKFGIMRKPLLELSESIGYVEICSPASK